MEPFRLVSTAAALPHVLHARRRVRTVARAHRHVKRKKFAKYLRYVWHISRATHLARRLGLHRGPPRRILDLGTGPGYFPFVCARMGHEVVALDVDWVPLYNDLTATLGVRRVVHEIRAHQPLPDLGGPFDLITAFLICFNGHKSLRTPLWGAEEWSWLVDQLAPLAAPEGCRLFLNFNREPSGVTIPDTLRQWFLARGGVCPEGGRDAELRLRAPQRLVSPPAAESPAAATPLA